MLWSRGYRYSFWHLLLGRQRALNEETERLLEELNLAERRDVPAGLLSYAEQRALEIGMTIAGGASVILLDEPTAGMSHSETEYAVALIRRVTQGKTLVMVEHDMRVVFDLADTITVLVYGRVDRVRSAGGDPRQPRRAGSLSRGSSRHDAGSPRPACLLRQEPHPAGRRPVGRRRRDRQPARPQRRRPVDHLQGDHGPGASRSARCAIAAGTSPVCAPIWWRKAGIGYVPEDRQIFPTLTVRQNLMLGLKRAGALRALEFR